MSEDSTHHILASGAVLMSLVRVLRAKGVLTEADYSAIADHAVSSLEMVAEIAGPEIAGAFEKARREVERYFPSDPKSSS